MQKVGELWFSKAGDYKCMRARGNESSPGRVEGSSCAMLATAWPSCTVFLMMVYYKSACF